VVSASAPNACSIARSARRCPPGVRDRLIWVTLSPCRRGSANFAVPPCGASGPPARCDGHAARRRQLRQVNLATQFQLNDAGSTFQCAHKGLLG
jgi:hypothetical protein